MASDNQAGKFTAQDPRGSDPNEKRPRREDQGPDEAPVSSNRDDPYDPAYEMEGASLQLYRKKDGLPGAENREQRSEITLEGDETAGDTARVARQVDEEPEWTRMKEGFNRQVDRQR